MTARNLEALLKEAIAHNAGDLLLIPGRPPIVRGASGMLEPIDETPLTPDEVRDMAVAAVVLHGARSAKDAIRRMIEVFPAEDRDIVRDTLSKVLRGVCAQTLLPRADRKTGRVAVYDVLIPDEEMRDALVEGHDLTTRKTPLPEGCQTFADEIQRLHREGLITEETARRRTPKA